MRKERLKCPGKSRINPQARKSPETQSGVVQAAVGECRQEVKTVVAKPKPRGKQYAEARLRRSGDRSKRRTVDSKRLQREIRIAKILEQASPPHDQEWLDQQFEERPTNRDQCKEGERPCPWIACRHHLYLDVKPDTGAIIYNFPGKEPWELEDTCALDLAEKGTMTLEKVGEALHLTRERIRQIEAAAGDKIKGTPLARELKGE